MNRLLFHKAKIRLPGYVLFIGLSFIFALNCLTTETFAQASKRKPIPRRIPTKKTTPTVAANLPKVTQIDTPGLQILIKRNGGENQKPLMVNFWATWCGPCVEEFPDLVKIDEEYRGKIDFITISMDDLADINTEVPKFLGKMRAKMPAYLLKTDDDEAAIVAVAKEWQGALPFTIIYNPKGEISYSKQGKIKPDDVRKEIDKITINQTANLQIANFPLNRDDKFSYEKGIEDAKKDIANGKLIIRRYGLTPDITQDSRTKTKADFKIEYAEHGCLVSKGEIEYIKGYNEISRSEIKRRSGNKISVLNVLD
jgi:thiol-disulfide isomerase/thioredoxin